MTAQRLRILDAIDAIEVRDAKWQAVEARLRANPSDLEAFMRGLEEVRCADPSGDLQAAIEQLVRAKFDVDAWRGLPAGLRDLMRDFGPDRAGMN